MHLKSRLTPIKPIKAGADPRGVDCTPLGFEMLTEIINHNCRQIQNILTCTWGSVGKHHKYSFCAPGGGGVYPLPVPVPLP